MTGLEELTWDDVAAMPEQTLVAAGMYQEGLRWLIMRGGFSLCAYVGVSKHSPARFTASENIPVGVHWGWTFGPCEGDDDPYPADWVWWGWDYGHAGDALAPPPGVVDLLGVYGRVTGLLGLPDTRWTPAMVKAELDEVLPEFDRWLRETTS